MQDHHFIRYFPYYFDPNRIYVPGNFEKNNTNKFREYNISNEYDNISQYNFHDSNNYSFYSTERPDNYISFNHSLPSENLSSYKHNYDNYPYSNDQQQFSSYKYNYDNFPNSKPQPFSDNYKSYDRHTTNSNQQKLFESTHNQFNRSYKYSTTNSYNHDLYRPHIETHSSYYKYQKNQTNHNYHSYTTDEHYLHQVNHHQSSPPPSHPLSKEDIKRQKIAQDNYKYVKNHPGLIDPKVETIDETYHSKITVKVPRPTQRQTPIIVTRFSTIDTAIYYHNQGYSRICLLNFADAQKAGGGYLNGRNAQEECLCRQTLLYPTLKASQMYQLYDADRSLYKSDIMVYSPNVYVIRDNSNSRIEIPFTVDIISAPAVDRRKHVKDANKIMERRIRKIIKLAAYKKNNVLVLGAFGCGVFNNNPSEISQIFANVLINEGLKDHFQLVVFPIYKDDSAKKIFEKALV